MSYGVNIHVYGILLLHCYIEIILVERDFHFGHVCFGEEITCFLSIVTLGFYNATV